MLVIELTVDDLLDLTRDTFLRLEEDGGNARYIVAVDRADKTRASAVSPDEEAVVRRESHRSNRLPCGEGDPSWVGRRRGVRHIIEVHLVRSRYERSRITEVRHQVRRRALGELDHRDRSTIDILRLSEVPSREASDEVLAIRVALEQQQGVVISIVPFTSASSYR